jgi:hypothetical protein
MLCCRLQLSVEAQVVASLASANSSLFLAFAMECPVLAVLLGLDGGLASDQVSVFCKMRSVQSSPHPNSLIESTFQRRSVSATDEHIRRDALKSSRKIIMEACGQLVERTKGEVRFSMDP